MTLVSVIIPNYNHEPYLAERIDSVLNQTHTDIEIILMDDCSTDGSRHVIEKYTAKYPQIQFLPNQVNTGNTFVQWNKGLEIAKGEWIWIAESDDLAEPLFLEKCLNAISDNTGLVFCQSKQIDASGKILGIFTDINKTKPNIWNHDFELNGIAAIKKLFIYGNAIPNASAVIFKKALSRPANTTFKLVGDYFYWLDIVKQTHIKFLVEPLNYFRTHQKNVRSQTKTIGFSEKLQVFKHIDHEFSLTVHEKNTMWFGFAQSIGIFFLTKHRNLKWLFAILADAKQIDRKFVQRVLMASIGFIFETPSRWLKKIKW